LLPLGPADFLGNFDNGNKTKTIANLDQKIRRIPSKTVLRLTRFRPSRNTPTDFSVELGGGHRTEDVMHHLCITAAAAAVLVAAGIAGRAAAAGVTPPSLGSESLPYAYGAPHGYRPQAAYGQTSPYALAPYTYSLPRRYAPHPPQHAFRASPAYGPGAEYVPAPSGYGLPPYANGFPPGYPTNPEYSLPPPYDRVPYAMPHDPNARFKAWNKIADSLTEALLQIRSAPSHGHSEFASRSATRPHRSDGHRHDIVPPVMPPMFEP
jgi:hypothetical protein